MLLTHSAPCPHSTLKSFCVVYIFFSFKLTKLSELLQCFTWIIVILQDLGWDFSTVHPGNIRISLFLYSPAYLEMLNCISVITTWAGRQRDCQHNFFGLQVRNLRGSLEVIYSVSGTVGSRIHSRTGFIVAQFSQVINFVLQNSQFRIWARNMFSAIG